MSYPGKGRADFLDEGNWNALCYECGRKRKASDLVKHWQGYYVCPEHWEARQPQDFVRGIKDIQTPPWVQPDSDLTFVLGGRNNGTWITGNGITIPDIYIPPYTVGIPTIAFSTQPEILNGGSGYKVGDTVTISGGTTITVTSVDGSGGVTSAAASTVGTTIGVCTATVIYDSVNSNAHLTLSNGSLTATSDGNASYQVAVGTQLFNAGRLYCEVMSSSNSRLSAQYIGLDPIGGAAPTITQQFNTGYGFQCDPFNPRKWHGGVQTAYDTGISPGGIISMLWDAGLGTLSFWVQGVDKGVAFTGVTGAFRVAVIGYADGAANTINFGQNPWAYTPPAGYLGWGTGANCGANALGGSGTGLVITIPTPVIVVPNIPSPPPVVILTPPIPPVVPAPPPQPPPPALVLPTYTFATYSAAQKSPFIILSNGNLIGQMHDYSYFPGQGLESGNPVQLWNSIQGNQGKLAGGSFRLYCEFFVYAEVYAGLSPASFPATTNIYTGQIAGSYGINVALGQAVVSVLFDAINSTLTFRINGSTAGPTYTGLIGTYFPTVSILDEGGMYPAAAVANFGQNTWTYPPPTGYTGWFS